MSGRRPADREAVEKFAPGSIEELEKVREPGESVWWYEVWLSPLCGAVLAADEDAALAAAADDAASRAGGHIDAGTWTIRRVEP